MVALCDAEADGRKVTSMLVNDQRDPGQSQATVGRPALGDATRVHQMQTGGVGEREVLIGVTPEQVPGSRQLLRPDRTGRLSGCRAR